MGGWQDISSAPKDGGNYLFWLVKADHFIHDSIFIRKINPRIFMGEKGSWSSIYQATHWQPLPKPPIAGEEE